MSEKSGIATGRKGGQVPVVVMASYGHGLPSMDPCYLYCPSVLSWNFMRKTRWCFKESDERNIEVNELNLIACLEVSTTIPLQKNSRPMIVYPKDRVARLTVDAFLSGHCVQS